jgi:hypothetical protein
VTTEEPNPQHPDDSDERATRGPDEALQGDERMYTGEPVETEDGPRRPQQMNVGIENMEGGGEWPDPHAPPRPGSVGEAEEPDARR